MPIEMRMEHLPCIFERDLIVPRFIEDHDHPWLQRLIERALGAEGMRAGDLEEHLLSPLPIPAPPAKQRLAAFMLEKLLPKRTDAPAKPSDLREAVFCAASCDDPRPVVLARVAKRLELETEVLKTAMYADLPTERIVVGLEQPPSPGALAARANLWLAQAWVARATRVRIDVKGASRSLIRLVRAKGLLCMVRGAPDEGAAVLDLSGPLSLFKNTRLYGQQLASLLPSLAWCDRWIVEADCMVNARAATFRISTGAPILPAEPAPRRFDSRAEERFARAFQKDAKGWKLVREPRPIAVDDGLVFPDFALEPPGAGAAIFVELIGFWTPDYLEEKLARYRRARLTNLILCIDEDLACSDSDFPPHARVVRFHKRVDVGAVIALAADLLRA
jgi:predicted nuclease of restriction endonuclease-like RecB superfamily